MISIDNEKCIGCGACSRDCWSQSIDLKNNKAVFNGLDCISCGHCFAFVHRMLFQLLVIPVKPKSLPTLTLTFVMKI